MFNDPFYTSDPSGMQDPFAAKKDINNMLANNMNMAKKNRFGIQCVLKKLAKSAPKSTENKVPTKV